MREMFQVYVVRNDYSFRSPMTGSLPAGNNSKTRSIIQMHSLDMSTISGNVGLKQLEI
jgi:hypothetical protein